MNHFENISDFGLVVDRNPDTISKDLLWANISKTK